jgi:hypothetical protein
MTSNGEFVAFWKSDPNTISFFTPSELRGPYFHYSLDDPVNDWNSARTSYAAAVDNDLDLYDDVINAAWHYFAQGMEFINKRAVMLSSIDPGTYYPRIWQGYYSLANPVAGYNAVSPRDQYGYQYTQSAVAAASLFDYLIEIFRHVEPSDKNYHTFSHKIRELLLLACTEIESEWRAVLQGNTRQENWRERYTTADYFRVKKPLRLSEWSVVLKEYEHLGSFTPFEKWSHSAPTKSLAWYHAYNAVKHDRAAEFSKATLENLLNAVSALHIMQAAQWGPEIFSLLHENRFSPFAVVSMPMIAISEVYMPSIDESRSLMASYYFDSQSAVNDSPDSINEVP